VTNNNTTEVGRLLRQYGVGNGISVREAGRRTGVSYETIAKMMRPGVPSRHTRPGNLDKLAAGLKIPRDLLERAMLIDRGHLQAAGPQPVADLLSAAQELSAADLAELYLGLAKILASRAAA
jgi:hypothetical protein